MLFFMPHPTYWADPGPLPVSGWRRWAWANLAKQPFFELNQEWVNLWLIYLDRLEREREAYQMWLDQQLQHQIIMEQYAERAAELADLIPRSLHQMGLSYRRTVRDRRDERPYTKVDYCAVEDYYFDEYAFYFWIATWPPHFPNGVTIDKFFPNQPGDSPVSMTLTAATGSPTKVEFNPHTHKERPGLWIIVEHTSGRGKIPNRVSYQKCRAQMPKGAKALAWPMGMGINSRMFILDLSEVYNIGIAGSVGGGKSNTINVILATFIDRNSPADLRLFMVDFKRVELAFYKSLPHLGGDVPYLQSETVDDKGKPVGKIKTVPADYEAKEGRQLHKPLGQNIVNTGPPLFKILDYLLAEIDRRTILMEGKVKNINRWNKRYPNRKLARWVLVIDELADVMLQFGKKVETKLVRIAQLGRAMGVHLILATQTPKSSVITQLIQNNITVWVAHRCGTGVASGLILDGKHDAAHLPAIPGRCIIKTGTGLIEMQPPEVTDMTIRGIVSRAKKGQTTAAADVTQYTVPPDKIFEYALKNFEGNCSITDIYNKFKKQGVPQREVKDILQDFEVAGTPPALEPEITIGDDEYYLAPSPGGRVPRQLVPVNQFTAEFEEKWAGILARRESQVTENGGTPQGDTQKSEPPQAPAPAAASQPTEPDPAPPPINGQPIYRIELDLDQLDLQPRPQPTQPPSDPPAQEPTEDVPAWLDKL